MKTIRKCVLVPTFINKWESEVEVELPVGAVIRSVQMQGPSLCMWVEGPAEKEVQLEKRVIKLVNSGLEIEDSCEYLGTVQLLDGQVVIHCYEKKS